mgnify:CR=1 FL=1
MKRLFLALWPDDSTRQAISGLVEQIGSAGIKSVKPSNLHVTLVFLGNVDVTTELSIRQQLDKIASRALSIQFDEISYWRKPGIICLTSEQQPGKDLLGLVRKLDAIAKSCGLVTDTRPYQAHITLARKACFQPEGVFDPIIWRAEAFCLVASVSGNNGVEYRVLQSWSLTKD